MPLLIMGVLGKDLDIIFIGEIHSGVLDEVPENSDFYRPIRIAAEKQENRIIEIIRKNNPDLILIEGTEVLLDPRLKSMGSFYIKNLVSLFGREKVKFIEINKFILEYVDRAEKLVAYANIPKEKRDPETERKIKTDYLLANNEREKVMAEIIAGNLASGMTAVAIVGRNHVENGSLIIDSLKKRGIRAGIMMIGDELEREHDKFLQWKVRKDINDVRKSFEVKEDSRTSLKGGSIKISNVVIENNKVVSEISSEDAEKNAREAKIKAMEEELSDPNLKPDERLVLENVLKGLKSGKSHDIKGARNSLKKSIEKEMINDAKYPGERETIKKAIENTNRGENVTKGMENDPGYVKSMKISFGNGSGNIQAPNKKNISEIYHLLEDIEKDIENGLEPRSKISEVNEKLRESERVCKITGDTDKLRELEELRRKIYELSKKYAKKINPKSAITNKKENNAVGKIPEEPSETSKKFFKIVENIFPKNTKKEEPTEYKNEIPEEIPRKVSEKTEESPEETIRKWLSEHFSVLERRDDYEIFLPNDNPIFRLMKEKKIDRNRALDIFLEKQWEFIKNKAYEGRNYWIYVSKYGNSMSGWKFHVYGNSADDALHALRKIYSYLEGNFINYKIGTKRLFEDGGRQGKKAVVIYIPKFNDRRIYPKIANDIKLLLGDYGKTGKIEGDAYMGGALNYRYEFTRKIGDDEEIINYTDSEKKRIYRDSDGNYNIPGNPDPFEELRVADESKIINNHEAVRRHIEETKEDARQEDYRADTGSLTPVMNSARKLFLEEDISIIIRFLSERLPEKNGIRQEAIKIISQEYSRFESEIQSVLDHVELLKRIQANTADGIIERINMRDEIIHKIEGILSRYHDKS